MKSYKSTKVYEAVPMTRNAFYDTWSAYFEEQEGDQEGYLLIHPDGCRSWISKTLFESTYQEVESND